MITEKRNNGMTLLKIFGIAIAAVFVVVLALEGIRLLGGNRSSSSLKVSFIDVGKGDCILVQNAEHAMLIDCGYAETTDTVLSYLKEAGVSGLEAIVVTHHDKDHAGGTAAILDSVMCPALYLPGYDGVGEPYTSVMKAVSKLGADTAAGKVTSDVSFDLGGATVTIFASEVEFDGDNDNDCSLVVSVRYGSDSYLFAGDLEKEGIKAFLSEHTAQWNVIKMPHHGNKKGAVDDLLDSVKPTLAVITDSSEDPAADEVLAFLEERQIKIYRTAKSGTIVITGNGNGMFKTE